MDNILTSKEISNVVKSLTISTLEEIGSMKWFKRNEKIIKLYQIAILQAKGSEKSECLKDFILDNDKVIYFISELITLSVWREKIFIKEMVCLQPDPQHSFPCYMILYHEGILVGMLQTLLFHGDVCRSLEDSAIDLIDYAVSQLINIHIKKEPILSNDTSHCKRTIDVILSQNQIISYNIAVQCIPILRYITEYLDDLPLSVSSHIYTHHDIPILISSLIYDEIWSWRDNNGIHWKYCETSWREWYPDDPVLSPTECQAWLLLHQLLIHKNSALMYEFTEYRRENLTKLLGRMNDSITDFLSPLSDLRQYLNQISMNIVTKAKQCDTPLLIEISMRMRDQLTSLPEETYKEMARNQSKLLFYGDVEEIQQLAMTMAETFGRLEEVSDTIRTCHNCFQKATKKCSKCKKVWYCSRDCQVQHWRAHKNVCCR